MVRTEIEDIARLASQSAQNFTQDVFVDSGYDSVSCRNYYTTRDGKVRIDWAWSHATVEVKTLGAGFWTWLTGVQVERWKDITLTQEEEVMIEGVYQMLEASFVRQHLLIISEAEKAEKLRKEKAIVESEQTRLLRNVLKAKPQPQALTAEEGANTTAFRLAREAGTAGTHDELDAKRYFAALNYIHTNLATLKHDCGSACGECIECIIYTAMTRMNPALRGVDEM